MNLKGCFTARLPCPAKASRGSMPLAVPMMSGRVHTRDMSWESLVKTHTLFFDMK